eukprot:TRINITY_DN12779_c0_g1_i1.p1 TRINITY_DN12779_c0_g1~~TRINITY_DN12779_c0_g1_i1.p1  ORF type:complete len:118 (-),score=30.41 TRINITY_DN12779_c0_g1_i1:87-440(-)
MFELTKICLCLTFFFLNPKGTFTKSFYGGHRSSLRSGLHHHYYKYPDEVYRKIPEHEQHFESKIVQGKPRPEPNNEIYKPRMEKRYFGLDIPDYVTSNNEEPRNQIRDIIKRMKAAG